MIKITILFFYLIGQQQAAIVSPIPGTTRDIVKITLDIGGYPVTLLDTAGLRNETDDVIEREGILRARSSALDADLILVVLDANQYLKFKSKEPKYDRNNIENSFNKFIENYIDSLNVRDVVGSCHNVKNRLSFISKEDVPSEELLNIDIDYRHCLIVFNKIDVLKNVNEIEQICEIYKNIVVNVSCKTETGFDNLLNVLTDSLKTL